MNLFHHVLPPETIPFTSPLPPRPDNAPPALPKRSPLVIAEDTPAPLLAAAAALPTAIR